jgi:hypothetical protein
MIFPKWVRQSLSCSQVDLLFHAPQLLTTIKSFLNIVSWLEIKAKMLNHGSMAQLMSLEINVYQATQVLFLESRLKMFFLLLMRTTLQTVLLIRYQEDPQQVQTSVSKLFNLRSLVPNQTGELLRIRNLHLEEITSSIRLQLTVKWGTRGKSSWKLQHRNRKIINLIQMWQQLVLIGLKKI